MAGESKCPICRAPITASDLGLCPRCWEDEKAWGQSS